MVFVILNIGILPLKISSHAFDLYNIDTETNANGFLVNGLGSYVGVGSAYFYSIVSANVDRQSMFEKTKPKYKIYNYI